jgi:Ni2+-binding GTPase involved in maturation of urease and hydrogenase
LFLSRQTQGIVPRLVGTRSSPSFTGLINADLLVINKTDLAPHVGADLAVMERDSNRLRSGPLVFTNCRAGEGVQEVADWLIEEMNSLVATAGVRLWRD